MGDVMYKIWASQQALDHVREDHPLTRLRCVCPECGNRTLHYYPFSRQSPGYQVFLWCECGMGDFCNEDDWKVRNSRLFGPSMCTNPWVADLSRRGMTCPKCGDRMEVMDLPHQNEATARCAACGHFEHVFAPVKVERRMSQRVAERGMGEILQFRPRDGAE